MNVIRIIKKFSKILNRHEKIRIFELVIIMIIGGFIETLSVSLVLPFMETIISPDEIMNREYIQKICNMFGMETSRDFLILVALCFAVIYILKNVYLLMQLTVQNRFVRNNMFATQQRLLHSFLVRPYEYFLAVQSGEIIRVVNSDTGGAFSLLTTLLSLFTELVVSSFLIATIFIISPFVTIAMTLLFLTMVGVIMHFIRPRLRKEGLASHNSGTSMNQWLMQSVHGIKELKIMNKQVFFEENFAKYGRISVRSNYIFQTLSSMPRFLIETISMSSFFLVVAFMIYRGVNLQSLIPMLSAVAIAAIRLLPSINRMSAALGVVAYNEPMVDKLIENINEANRYEKEFDSQRQSSSAKSVEKIKECINFSAISYCYPQREKSVLVDASFSIKKGESIGIVGPSGVGKTTTVDILLGLLKPQKGKVLIDGTDIELDIEGWMSQIGYIPQSIFVLDGSIRDNVAFGVQKDKVDDKKVWKALREAAMEEFVKQLPEGLDTQLGERGVSLSGGQRQRVGIARALYNNPQVLVFDEATSALDNETEKAIMESIDGLHGEKTMIIIAHRLTTIEGCDKIYRVEDGKIFPAGDVCG